MIILKHFLVAVLIFVQICSCLEHDQPEVFVETASQQDLSGPDFPKRSLENHQQVQKVSHHQTVTQNFVQNPAYQHATQRLILNHKQNGFSTKLPDQAITLNLPIDYLHGGLTWTGQKRVQFYIFHDNQLLTLEEIIQQQID